MTSFVEKKGDTGSLVQVKSTIQAPYIVFPIKEHFLPISAFPDHAEKNKYYDALMVTYQTVMEHINTELLISIHPLDSKYKQCYSIRMLEVAITSAISHELISLAKYIGSLTKEIALVFKTILRKYLKSHIKHITYEPLKQFIEDMSMYKIDVPLYNLSIAPTVQKACKELHRYLNPNSLTRYMPDLVVNFPYLRAKFYLFYSQLQMSNIKDNIGVQQLFLALAGSEWAKYDPEFAKMVREVQSLSKTIITATVQASNTYASSSSSSSSSSSEFPHQMIQTPRPSRSL